MKVIPTKLKGCYIIELDIHGDDRGYFTETYNKQAFNDSNLSVDFVQDNQSFSNEKGTIRGIHLQNNPMAQTKLVYCSLGMVFDVAVDLRTNSPTYGEWVGVELSPVNHRQLFIPRGFGHAFQTLADNTVFQYKVDNFYSKEHEKGIIYNDCDIKIDWPLPNPILSVKDWNAPVLRKVDIK
jgi:dTDP-4-dehydrorhamnose 3,5-epimerase